MRVVLDEVLALPDTWHGAGSCAANVLRAIGRCAEMYPIKNSAETGTGKTTLLLSHLSAHHTVFTKDDAGDGDSLLAVQSSPLLRRDTVRFVLGPTQRTVPQHTFSEPLDFAMIDGPHGYPFPELEYYSLYPHLRPGALLVIDDIHIPTVHHLFAFLRDDTMFDLHSVVATTALFRRTDAPVFNPLQDGWETQGYNMRRFPVINPLATDLRPPWHHQLWRAAKRRLPPEVKRAIKRIGRMK